MLVGTRDRGNEKELYIYKYKTRSNRIKCMHGLSRYAEEFIYIKNIIEEKRKEEGF